LTDEVIKDGGWTLATYAIYNEALRAGDAKFQDERDKRYADVATEREKALKIKETADLAALELARESQKYKEERNDAMREQTITDKGRYATHADVAMVVERMEKALRPLVEFVNGQQGATASGQITTSKMFSMIAATGTIVGILVFLANYLFK
jgi:hypothetical protein